jgi:mono/diheme cytochrome c family protein
MKTLTTLIIAVAVALLGIVSYAYSGLYDVSASSAHSGFVDWLLSTTSRASIERRAGEIEVPDLDSEDLVLAGINDFDSMCAGCHGAPGKDPEAMGQGLNPPAPDLAEEAAEMSPAELFWVTRNGIRMTGMPAWGATHDDASIWPVVAFMTRLPELDASAYQELLAAAEGQGHHAADAAGDVHSHEDDAGSTATEIHVHEDGSEHVHEEAAEPEPPVEHDHSTHEHDDA